MPYKDPEKRRKYQRKYQKEWRQNRIEEYRVWNRERMKKWYKENSKVIYQKRREGTYEKLAASIRTRIRGVIKLGYKSAGTEELLGITVKGLKTYLENRFQSGMNWDNYGFYGWHIDHIKPLSRFNLKIPEEQKEAFNYTNLQPLWAKENMHKGAKMSY